MGNVNTLMLHWILLACAPIQQVDAPLAERIRAFLASDLADGMLSGTLLVAKGDEVQYEASFGMASHELGVKNTPSTRFCIASVTKPMTQAVVIQLIQEGVLGVDAPIAQWLEGFPRGESITVMHVLSHSAGIPHRVTTDDDEWKPLTAREITDRAARRLDEAADLGSGAPGEKSVYSSAGYSVLARICEVATGKQFPDLLQERLFQPAGMSDTEDTCGSKIIKNRAASYVMTPEGPRNAPLKNLSFLVGAGSVVSTPRDLLRYLRAVLDRKLGEGVAANALARGKISWNGVTNGYRCFVEYDPASDLAVIFAGNMMTGASDRIRAEVPKIAAGEAVPAPPRLAIHPQDPGPDVLDSFAGAYDFSGTALEVQREGAMLWIGDSALVPVGKDEFFAYRDYGKVTAQRDEKGELSGLVWHSGGMEFPMPKMR